MNARISLAIAMATVMCALNHFTHARDTPIGSAITYQGMLKHAGAPVNGSHHLRFQLWDALSDGVQVGADVDVPSLAVDNGLFTVELEFGTLPFNGSARWLQVQVVTDGGNTVTTLVPRQPISATPYALYALAADGPNLTNLNASNLVSGTVPGAQLGGTYDNATTFSNAANAFTGTFTGSGAALASLNASNVDSGNLPVARLPSGGGWTISSNLNIDSNTLVIDQANNRVGIGTATPLNSVHVAGDAAALRLQDDGDSSSFVLLEALQPGQMRLNNVASTGTSLIDINPQPLNGTQNAHLRFFRETNTTGAKSVIFHSGNNSTATSAVIGVGGSSSVFQLDGGNVGIGTPNPAVPLHIARDLDSVIVLQDTGDASFQSGYVGFWNNLGTETGWMGFGTPGSRHFSIRNSRIDGNVQLIPGPGGFVTVEGIAKFPEMIVTTEPTVVSTVFDLGVVGTAGKTGGGSWSVLSDRRLKKHVEPVHDSLERLLALRGVTYEYVDPDSIGELHGTRIGMIAQEVELVFPDWVEAVDNGYKALTFRGFEALTVEAFRDLRAEKDAELDSLRAEITRLDRRLAELERLIQQALVPRSATGPVHR